MRRALISVDNKQAGELTENPDGSFTLSYFEGYQGPAISVALPVSATAYHFPALPPFFEGLLPEGIMLEALLRKYKLDKDDLFEQLLKVGEDVVGNVTIEEIP